MIWAASNLAVGLFSLYLGGYFLMALLAAFLFPLTQTLLIMLRSTKEEDPGYWLLNYLAIFIIVGINNIVSPIIILLIYVLISEIVLMLITNKFGRFVFSAITLSGLGLLYAFSESILFNSLDIQYKYVIILLVSSFVTGFGIEAHRWNVSKMKSS